MSREARAMSRRELLRVAGSCLAAPYVLTSSALGSAAAPPASDRTTLGFIGLGRQGLVWVQTYRRLKSLAYVGLCDVDGKKRQYGATYVGRYHKGCPVYRDFRELLARDDLDAVVVATPDHWHAICTIQAAKAGKDVYCEAPLSLTVREAREMATVAARYGRVVQAGSRCRSMSQYRTACELVRAGLLGTVQTVYITPGIPSRTCHLAGQPAPSHLDWDFWLGPAPWAPYHSYRCASSSSGSYGWRAWRDYSGGTMAFYGSLYLDVVHWALGLDETDPVEITPADRQAKTPVTLRYESGLTVHLAVGPHKGPVEFVGEDGALAIGVGQSGFQTWPEQLAQEPLQPNRRRLRRSTDHFGDFLSCVKNRRRPACDVEIACRTVTAAHLCNVASWIGRPIKWDPDTEQIVGDPQAARWLDRPRRTPWRL